MEEALGPFHVPQQSRRVKLRITPTTDHRYRQHHHHHHHNQSYDIYPPQVNDHFDHHYPHLSDGASSSSAAPLSSSSQFPPPRFISLPSSLATNDAEAFDGGAEMIPSSSSSGTRLLDPVIRDSEVGLRKSALSSATMIVGGSLNLSLATHARGGRQVSAGRSRSAAGMAIAAAPVGPFTGYASILSRSRFLKPAEELLEGFCGVIRREKEKKVLEDSVEDWTGRVNITDRCGDSSLLNLLHEVYKRYKLYCQQMHSAVTSFESVAGLGNAAPFISYAIKAVSKHFHCLKNAILDHINFSNNGIILGGGEFGKSNDRIKPFSEHRCYSKPKQIWKSSLNHHPVWRSQRGFPDKAVAVLKAWLFENFLHPYPTDSDKETLACKTGLSRSQVSNWFTNARVRLWKPMVEEIHSLEKQTGFSSESEHRKLVNVQHFCSVNPRKPPEKDIQASRIQRVRFSLQADGQGQEEGEKQPRSLVPCDMLSSNSLLVGAGGYCETGSQVASSSSHMYSSNEDSTTALPWSTSYGQNVPFWLTK